MSDDLRRDATLQAIPNKDVGFDDNESGKMQAACPRCQHSEVLVFPVSVPAFLCWLEYFAERHRHCEKQ